MRIVLLILAAAALLSAQEPSLRPGDKNKGEGNVLGVKPNAPLKVQKLKGVIHSVDLDKRTVSITGHKSKAPLELAFSQPSGREQIKASRKAAKATGKNKLTLEELESGTKVQLRYYPALGQVMELLVDAS